LHSGLHVGLSIEGTGIQIPAWAELWFEPSALPALPSQLN